VRAGLLMQQALVGGGKGAPRVRTLGAAGVGKAPASGPRKAWFVKTTRSALAAASAAAAGATTPTDSAPSGEAPATLAAVGRAAEPATASGETEEEKFRSGTAIRYRYNEGFTNAIRHAVLMRDLL